MTDELFSSSKKHTPDSNKDDTYYDQLKQDNERLTDLVFSLKSQLNQALEFSEQNELLIRENSTLKSKVRNLEANNDELVRRMEIQLKLIDEGKAKLASEKSNYNRLDNPDLQRILKENSRMAKIIENLNIDIDKRDKLLSSAQAKNDSMAEEINRLLKVSQEKFSTIFKSVSGLTSFIEVLPEAKDTQDELNLSSKVQIVEEHQKEVQKLTKKLEKEKKARQAAESSFHMNNSSLETERFQYMHQIQTLKSQLDEARHDLELANMYKEQYEKNMQKDLSDLRAKNKSLESKLNQISHENKLMHNDQTVYNLQRELSQCKAQYENLQRENRENNALNSKLHQKESQYRAKIKVLEDQLETSANKLKDCKSHIAILTAEVDALKCERSSLVLEKTSLEDQVKTTNARLTNSELALQQNKNMKSEHESFVIKHETSVSTLEEIIAFQKKEIKNLYDERDRIISILTRQASVIKSVESKLTEFASEIRDLKKQLKQANKKLQEEANKPPVSFEPPVTAWFNSEFPSDLCNQISKYAQSETIDLPVKLRNVLSLIGEYYNQKISSLNLNHNEELYKLNRELSVADKFLSSIGKIYERHDLNVKNLVDDNRLGLSFIDQITQCHQNYMAANQQNQKLQESLSSIYKNFESRTPKEFQDSLDKLCDHVNSLKQQLKSEREENQSCKKQLKQNEKTLNAKFASMMEQISQMENDIVNKNSEIEELRVKVRDLTLTVNQQKCELNNCLCEKDNQLNELKNEHESNLSKLRSKYETERINSSAELTKRDEIIDRLKTQIVSLESEIDTWRRNYDLILSTKEEKDRQISNLLEQLELSDKEYRDRADFEREKLKEQYDMFVNGLKNKNTELVGAHEAASALLQEANNRNKEISERFSSLQRAYDDLKYKTTISNEEVERERKFIEMKNRYELLRQETRYQSVIDDLKASFTIEKRKIISYIAQNFRQYFDAKHELEEESFKIIVTKAREELDRLLNQETSIRHLLGLTSKASIEDAVAKLILSMYQTDK